MISPFALPGLIVWSLDYFGRFRGEVLFLAIRTLDLHGAINVKFTHLKTFAEVLCYTIY